MVKCTLILFFFVLFNAVVCRRHGRRLYNVRDGKIVGGSNTTIQEVPYMAYLILQKPEGYFECGGSIISPRYVLTAGHCLVSTLRIYARVGSTDSDSGGSQYNSTRYRIHPLFNPTTFDFDIALIYFFSRIFLDGVNTMAVPLPPLGSTLEPGSNVRVSGWGDTSENGEDSENLMSVEIPIIAHDVCQQSYSTLTPRQFCAGLQEGGKDSCQGDSGGPAVLTENGVQVGIVSFGMGCARPGYPGVYTNLTSTQVRRYIRGYTGV